MGLAGENEMVNSSPTSRPCAGEDCSKRRGSPGTRREREGGKRTEARHWRGRRRWHSPGHATVTYGVGKGGSQLGLEEEGGTERLKNITSGYPHPCLRGKAYVWR